MSHLLSYLIQSSLSLSVLIIAYKLLFSKQATFTANRVILLIIVMFGFAGTLVSPVLIEQFFISGSKLPVAGLTGKIITIGLQEITVQAHPVAGIFSFSNLFLILYLGGSVIMLARLLFNIFKIIRLYAISDKIKTGSYTFVLLNNNTPPFSFFNLLFINKELHSDLNRSRQIIRHEEIHIKQHHSIDVLLVETLIIFQWFNPFVYILKKAITENHEYLADRGTIAVSKSISDYKVLVLTHSIQQRTSMLANNFSYLLIKKRIKMMEKQKSTIRMTLSAIGFVMILAMVMVSCTQKSEPKEVAEPTAQVTQPEAPKLPIAEKQQPQEKDSIYIVVENMPEFPGGRKALFKYLSDNIKYPESAKKKGIHGRVFINFTVEKDGSISDVKILRGIGGGCDEEAIRVVKAMPKWKPGEQDGKVVRVDFNLPVKFVLD